MVYFIDISFILLFLCLMIISVVTLPPSKCSSLVRPGPARRLNEAARLLPDFSGTRLTWGGGRKEDRRCPRTNGTNVISYQVHSYVCGTCQGATFRSSRKHIRPSSVPSIVSCNLFKRVIIRSPCHGIQLHPKAVC